MNKELEFYERGNNYIIYCTDDRSLYLVVNTQFNGYGQYFLFSSESEMRKYLKVNC